MSPQKIRKFKFAKNVNFANFVDLFLREVRAGMKALAEQRRVGLLAGKLAGGSGVARTARLAVEHSEPASVANQGLGLAKLGKLAKFCRFLAGSFSAVSK